MRKGTIGAMVLAWSACVAPAHADTVQVSTTEHGTWRESIAALQRDVGSGGTTLHVQVRDVFGGQLACGRYSLEPDAVTAAVFEIGTCDPTSGATPFTLRNRDALFIPADPVPRMQTAGLTVVEIRRSTVEGGGEAAGSSEVDCTASVRPYLDDLQHGGRVYLTPGRYALTSMASTVRSISDGTGWTLHGDVHTSVSIEYEVTDTARNEVVLHDRATLTCAHEAVVPPGAANGLVLHDPLTGRPLTGGANAQRRATSSATFFATAVGPGIAGIVYLAVGLAVGDGLEEVFVPIGIVASGLSIGLITAGIVHAVNAGHANDAAHHVQLVSLDVAPVGYGNGAMVSAGFRF